MVRVNSAGVQRKHPYGKADKLFCTSWFFIQVTEVIVDKNADLATLSAREISQVAPQDLDSFM